MEELQRPDTFEFQYPERWPEWAEQWDRYRDEKLCAEPDEVQISSLLLAIGDEARDIIKSLELSDHQRQQYKDVRDAWDEYFEQTKHVVQERFKFYVRRQRVSETARDYISRIRKMANTCDFADVSTQIRDRLVSGISDSTLSGEMQRMSGLQLTEEVATRMILEAERKKAQKRPSTTTMPESNKAHKSNQSAPATASYLIPSTFSVEQGGYSNANPMQDFTNDVKPIVVTPQAVIKTETSIPEGTILPENRQWILHELIKKLKEKAATMGTHKSFFRNSEVQELLLQIDAISQQQEGQQVWKEVYADLAGILNITEQTMKKCVKTCRLDQEVTVRLQYLKKAIDFAMPELIRKHDDECKKINDEKARRAILGTPGPRIAAPVRHFVWTEEIRSLLCEVVAIKMKQLFKKKAEKLVDFFEFDIMLLWPERWMTIKKLWTTSAKCHQLAWPTPGSSIKKQLGRSNTQTSGQMNTSRNASLASVVVHLHS